MKCYRLFLLLVLLAGACRGHRDTVPGAVKDSVVIAISDSQLLDIVQKQTCQYFYAGAEPVSGMARERYHADNIYPQNDQATVTSGGSGFGVMALLVAMQRNFISREQGRHQMEKIIGFLKSADRFHGAWPHWWNGETGKTIPFSPNDNGGDIVETSYLVQGLLCARQYFKNGNEGEQLLSRTIDTLWRNVEFDWYRNGKNVIYWHWSPDKGWKMNFPVQGYNECLILYILGASSPTHGISPEVYEQGWAQNGNIKSSHSFYGYPLQLNRQGGNATVMGGPLFWSQYSYLALDPRGLKDQFADYWEENRNQSLINYTWCVKNPNGYKGYGPNEWGLTASYSIDGYSAHSPGTGNDLSVISPTAALSSFPYTPGQSMHALKYWYANMKDKLWGDFGFYDAYSKTANWYPKRYLAIDQGPIVVMIENYRSGLLWKLFMSCPEIKEGLKKLHFSSPWLK